MSKNKHKKIADAFAKLTSTLNEKKDEYLEDISKIINKAIRQYDDKKLWKESYDKIVDLMYAALTDAYLETIITLKDVYINISDETLDVEDFIYKNDNMTLPERVKKYWDEAASFLKNPEADTTEISLYLLSMYDRILTNEMQNIKTGVQEAKKIKDTGDLVPIIEIIHSDICSCEECNGLEGFYLEDDDPGHPPFHIGCQCEWWWDLYDPNDPQDLEVLQEAGWEEDDG